MAGLLALMLTAAAAQDGGREPRLSVSAEGSVEAKPDHALVTLGVRTQGPSAAGAMEENATRMRELVRALKEAGIPPDHLRTSTLRLEPRPDDKLDAPPAFVASNEVEVRVGDLPRLGTLLDQALRAGANVVRGISFGVSERDRLLRRARAEAMGKAREKAEQLAELAHARLGPVLSVSESVSGGPERFARQAAAAVPLEPGAQEVGLRVHVTWLLLPR